MQSLYFAKKITIKNIDQSKTILNMHASSHFPVFLLFIYHLNIVVPLKNKLELM